MRTFIVSSLALVSSASLAAASWTPIARMSRIQVIAGSASGQDVVTHFNPYSNSISRTGVGAGVTSSQTSSLTATQILLSSSSEIASYSLGGGSGSFGNASVVNTLRVDFAASDSMSFVFSGSKRGLPSYNSIYLKNLTTNTFVFILSGIDPDDFTKSGLLANGNYRLEMTTEASTSGFTSSPSINATFTFVPAPSSMGMLAACGLVSFHRRRR